MADLELESVRIVVVVPAHNEERHIRAVVEGMPSFVDEIIVVDDASDDLTSTLATELTGHDSRVVSLRHGSNRGVGAAIVTGYEEALRRDAEVVVVMAGDGQMDPADLPPLVRGLLDGDFDYVKGDRLTVPQLSTHMPLLRAVGSRVLSRLTSWASGVRVHDSQCGYTAIRGDALRRLNLASLWPRYGYPNDLIGRVALGGMRINEVPVRAVYRDESSGLRVWHVPRIVWLIGRIAWRRGRGGEALKGSFFNASVREPEMLPLRHDEASFPKLP